MAFASLMVHVDLTQESPSRSALAAELALDFGARLIGVAAAQPAPIVFGDATETVLAAIMEAEQERTARELTRAGDRFLHAARAVREIESRIKIGDPTGHLIEQSRASDLLIVGRPDLVDDADNPMAISVGAVLMAAGRPLLCLPQAVERFSPGTILVAWKNSREARRAVADALPLLKKAEHVIVACIGRDASAEGTDDLVTHLRRHDVPARAMSRPRPETSVAAELLRLAEFERAGLIVAGAYGHSRMREWIFGGVTRDLLRTATVPCLLSH